MSRSIPQRALFHIGSRANVCALRQAFFAQHPRVQGVCRTCCKNGLGLLHTIGSNVIYFARSGKMIFVVKTWSHVEFLNCKYLYRAKLVVLFILIPTDLELNHA